MEFLGSETIASLFASSRSSRRAGGPQLDGAERTQLKGVLKAKGRLALADVEKEIGNAYKRALDVKLIDIFLGAWSSISAVAALGDTVKYPPGERHLVPLANHRVTSSHHPKVEVLIDGIPLITLTLDVSLQAQFEGAVLEVDGGHIHAAKPGHCRATASVSCRGVPIASVNSRRLAFPGEINLKPPFAIPAITGATILDRKSTLTLSGRDEEGRLIEFHATPRTDEDENSWLVGRRPDRANFVLSHRLVSGEHARIRFSRARGMEICDLDSSNGTLLNGRPIGRDYVSLASARKIAFGGFEMDVRHG